MALQQETLWKERLLTVLLAALLSVTAKAQQPVEHLPEVAGCPLGYYASGSYCVQTR